MPVISKVPGGDLRIVVHYNDHNPPHFHVHDKSHSLATVDMQTLDVKMEGGALNSHDRWTIVDWARKNKKKLIDAWNAMHDTGRAPQIGWGGMARGEA